VGKGRPRSLTAGGFPEQLVTWLKPKTCPAWLARKPWAALPAAWTLREGRDPSSAPGCRTRHITVVTPRLEAAGYRVAELAELYRRRWQVETSLAQLKTIMQMDVLRCKTDRGY
jgi:transposase